MWKYTVVAVSGPHCHPSLYSQKEKQVSQFVRNSTNALNLVKLIMLHVEYVDDYHGDLDLM